MADRVHPAETIAPPPPPPAPPSLALQVQKKQDVIFQVPKDVVYKVPLGNPSWSRPRRRRRSPCCCCLSWLCSLLFTLVVLVVIAAAVFYFVLQPRAPKYSVQNVQIRQFNLTADSHGETHLNSNVLFTIKARNPNKKIGIYYSEVDATLSYEGVEIGRGSVVPFYQGHKNTTILVVPLKGQHVLLKEEVGSTLTNTISDETSIALRIDTAARLRLKFGSWNPRIHFKVHVTCYVQMTSPARVGSAGVESKSCKFKVKV